MKKYKILFLIFNIFFIKNVFSKNIKEIKIIGNKRYNDLTYKKMITLNSKVEFTVNDKNKIIQDIFASNVVDDVKVDYKNNTLFVEVEERVFVKKITFKGNKKLKDDIIKQNFKLKVKESFSNNLLKQDLQFIKAFYNSAGLLNAKIKYEIKEFEKEGLVEVIFNIEEGKKAKINSISLIGNKNIKSRILKDEIYSKENAFFRFGARIVYNEDFLEYDSYLLSQVYLRYGYLDFEIISKNAFFNKKKNNFDIVFVVKEGEKYFNEDIILINNIKNLDTVAIQKEINKIKKNKIFNYQEIKLTLDKINSILIEKGILYSHVWQNILPDQKTKMVKTTFTIDYTKNNYIQSININNNTKTYDYLIRQQMLLTEGDLFNKEQIDKSIQKIKNLGFFKNVSYEYKENNNSMYDVNIEVEETTTGSIGGSIGYSTLDKENVSLNYSQKNLFGKGVGVDTSLSLYKYSKKLSFDITKPQIYNTNINLNSGIYFNNNNESKNSILNIGYDSLNWGVYNSFYFELFENISQKIGYSYSYQTLNNIALEYQGVVNDGKQRTSEITNSFYYDTRDYFYSPSKGVLVSLDTNIAGIFGNRQYIKNVLYGSYYKSIYDNIVLKVEGKAGFIASYGSNSLFPTDGFYLGGYNMRGFESSGIGPKVKPVNPLSSLKDGYGVGGTNLYFTNIELKIPLGLPREIELSAILFFNAGTVTGIESNKDVNKNVIVDSGKIRSAMGVSFMWRTPININISLDISKTVSKEEYDLDRKFRFNIGKSF